MPPDAADRLGQRFRSTPDAKRRLRLRIVLMAHRGRPRQDVATDLGIHKAGVSRWLNAYAEQGLDALRPKKARGKPGPIPAELADEIRRRVSDGPAGQGLDRANRTYEELADHLFKTHGIKTSRSAKHRFCQKIGVRLYRPTYRYLRGDPDKQAKAREDLAGLKRGRRLATSCC